MKKLRNVIAAVTLACGIGAIACGTGAIATDWASLAQTSSLNNDKISASESAFDFTQQKNDKIHQLEYDLDQNTITSEEFIKQVNYLNSRTFKRDVVYDLSGVTEQQKNNFKAREQEIQNLQNTTPVLTGAGISLLLLSGAGLTTENILDNKNKKQTQPKTPEEQNSNTLDL